MDPRWILPLTAVESSHIHRVVHKSRFLAGFWRHFEPVSPDCKDSVLRKVTPRTQTKPYGRTLRTGRSGQQNTGERRQAVKALDSIGENT